MTRGPPKGTTLTHQVREQQGRMESELRAAREAHAGASEEVGGLRARVDTLEQEVRSHKP